VSAKTYATAAELPAQYRQLAEYFANPHSLIYHPLDRFYDFLADVRLADAEQMHATPSGCACTVCRTKAGHTPALVKPLRGDREPGAVLWRGHYVAADVQGRTITQETPCVGKAQGQCPCYWCQPYHYDAAITNRQALERLMGFIRPMVPVVRARRLDGERAALLAELARVESEMQTATYQPTLV
jgi:hypothetical protein